ncbi:MAG TPA: hypothetical protein VHH73_17265 [Verrucomicrobiae bacterium]|nr:hypothetical protein [Verrucomicrobiae bacterium]
MPASLVASPALTEIIQLNSRLPAALTSTGGFECPLGAVEPVADWQWCVKASDGGREVIAGKRLGEGLPADFLRVEGWRRIRQLAGQWANPESLLHSEVDRLWLEFDRADFANVAPVPSLFVSIHSGSEVNEHPKALDAALLALHLLNDGTLDGKVEAKLRSCFEALPKGAIPAYAALMLARNTPGARLVMGLPLRLLRDYLRQVNWPGAMDELLRFVTEVAPFVERLFFNLDVAGTLSPRIGIECHLRNKQPATEPRWQDLVGYFVKRGWCLPEKAAGLLAWPGHERAVLADDLLPVRIFRGLHHLKVVFAPDTPPQAKGYLNVWKSGPLD